MSAYYIQLLYGLGLLCYLGITFGLIRDADSHKKNEVG